MGGHNVTARREGEPASLSPTHIPARNLALAEKSVFQSLPGGRCTRISLAHQRAPSERSSQNSASLCDEDVVVGFVIQKSRSLYLLRSICMAMMVPSSFEAVPVSFS